MVNIKKGEKILCSESECTGCAACAASCVDKCIDMIFDIEGFIHPSIDNLKCTNCGRCSMACHIISHIGHNDSLYTNSNSRFENRECEKVNYPIVYAAWHLDGEIREKSSSGGVFTALAEQIMNQDGAVVGAAYNKDLVVEHEIIEKVSEIDRLRGSKYVQSNIAPKLLCQVREMLEHGRKVLFTGTPCQVAGLKRFLNKSYDSLFCCDLVCHGVPSPLLFNKYKYNLSLSGSKLLGLSFRDKKIGWKKCGVRQELQNGKVRYKRASDDPYIRAFLRNYTLRSSCYECNYKSIFRVGDITIGDFWGVSVKYPQYDKDDKGTSLVLVNNVMGERILAKCKYEIYLGKADIETAINGNPCLVISSKRPFQRESFYEDLKLYTYSEILKKYNLNYRQNEEVIMMIKRFVVFIYELLLSKKQ